MGGTVFNSIKKRIFRKSYCRVFILGPGWNIPEGFNSSLEKSLKLTGKSNHSEFSRGSFIKRKINFSFFDMTKTNQYNKASFFKKDHLLMYVIESSRVDKIEEAILDFNEYLTLSNHGYPFLIFVYDEGKDVRISSVNLTYLINEMLIIKDIKWRVFECCLLNGKGIEEGFEWLLKKMT
jgi:hypothetical protein